MKLFLLFFLLIYGGFHLLFFLRINAAIRMGGGGFVILLFLLAAGFLAPLIIRAVEGRVSDLLVRFFALIGYYWMAFLLLFLFVSLFVELYNFVALAVVSRFNGNINAFIPTVGMRFMIPAVVAVLLAVYGSFEAGNLRTEFLTIHSEKIPKEIGKMRILQISDVHIGGAVQARNVSGIIRAIREAAPDLVVSTGDLVDGRGAYIGEAASQFSEIKPKWGKFAVAGNHEFYLGIERASEFMEKAGFVFLRNRTATIAGVVALIGVGDPGGVRATKVIVDDRELLSRTEGNHFKILLKHRPDVEKKAIGLFELQLSGHTHKGQIFPFSIITNMVFPYHAGNYRLSQESLLHVSRGAGVWGPPIRLLAPPEIMVIDLLPK
ncbi:MAG: metallophosphoesterase [Syntrophobacterales bacterium]|nr:metallophosphoesterase [Syntrophobacterales bacterium]